eukprot:scaffold2509_cov169-Amphora_coffeaeformis.AAC.15
MRSSSSARTIIKYFRRSHVGKCQPRRVAISSLYALRRQWLSITTSSSRRGRLTQMAHASIGAVLGPGDFAVDATAGKGYDTVFLANQVGFTGQVLALDVQLGALEATRERLRAFDCETQVRLIHGCHSLLHEYLPTNVPLQAAMFNLGFLPGSNKEVVTRPQTTIAALATCLESLRISESTGGMVSVMAYRGHPGGQDEADSIADFLGGLLPHRYKVQQHEAPGSGPHLWLVQRIR